MKLRCGTRGSALALAQTDWVLSRLRALVPGLELERVVIRTSGDRFSAAAPVDAPAAAPADAPAPAPAPADGPGAFPNVKAMFVKEIEEALLDHSIDFAVHSCKDLPGETPPGLTLAAFPIREDPRDVYVGGPSAPRWEDLKAGDGVATSSPRRRAQLSLSRPGLRFVELRGNVDTRLTRLAEGRAAGLVLAAAGLKRLGLDATPRQALPLDRMVPAPGQGALALEARREDGPALGVLSLLDHPDTRFEVECERFFLRVMGGGCQSPLGAHASKDSGGLRFLYFWSDSARSRGEFRCEAERVFFEARASRLAREMLRGP